MLHLNIKSILREKGFGKPVQFLVKLGLTRFMADKLLHDNYEFINIHHLTKICKALDCTPNDILAWKDDAHDVLPEGHRLNGLRREEHVPIADKIQLLSLEQIEEVRKFMEGMTQKK
jgi:DNA-binding Xre family transcriptional regulator